MYTCSICGKEVIVDPTVKAKCCEGGTVTTKLSSNLHGFGGLNEAPKPNNNLSEESAMVVKQMMSMVLGTEFFRDGKTEVFANEIVIEDSSTGRRFSFTLTAKEL